MDVDIIFVTYVIIGLLLTKQYVYLNKTDLDNQDNESGVVIMYLLILTLFWPYTLYLIYKLFK